MFDYQSQQSQHDRRPNRLIHETSPYLLQHAYNPVEWYPWGDEALQAAKDVQKPILLSIGYSACHWCHVMERESFEDEKIASYMNEHFICIKVDREERPDLDDIYMQATLAMNQGQGGWPMTVFLTPEQQPIFAGTYFPPTDRWGRPGFLTVLQKIAEIWTKDPDGLRDQASRLTTRIQQEMTAPGSTTIGQEELERAVAQFSQEFDSRYGGFGSAPKFPPATGLLFLLQQHTRTGHAEAIRMVRTTLDAMAAGGIYDQIGGGFARYSTDERWLVPHFEKMLYDNALLARAYVEAYQATGEPLYRRIASETLDYVLREMQDPKGGFYSSTDADSEGVEGKFFVWTPEGIHALAPSEADAKRFCAYFDVTPQGNWEKTNILHTPRSVETVASELGISENELRTTIDRMRPLVYAARQQRVPPGLDDKILTGWNGMMLSALAVGARILDEPRYRRAAEQAAEFILGTLQRPDGGLFRTFRQGKAHLTGVLEDYAFFGEGLIDLYEAGASGRYIQEARRLGERIIADFADEEHGGFFTTARDHEALVVRAREGADGATPSGNAVAASVLARLAGHFGRDDLREASVKAVRAYGRYIEAVPRAFAKSLLVLDFLLHGPVELAFVGNPADTAYEALWREAQRSHLPNHVIAHGDPEREPEAFQDHPLLQGKGLVGGKPALYICRNFSCRQPITDPSQMSETLNPSGNPGVATDRSTSRLLTETRLSGSATKEGTTAYAERFVESFSTNGFVPLATTGLMTSRVGFGGYRVETRTGSHRDALVEALKSGCNLIDTSTNYTDGESERLIGSVLRELTTPGGVGRNQVIVVSKIGYVQGQNLKLAQEREQAGHPFPDMVKYGEDLWHCIHPEFVADQLERSRDRLGLDTLDILLLHNPEYALMEAGKKNEIPLEQRRREFYDRLRATFTFLESQVAAGELRYYGVSSNTAIADPSDPEAVSLSRLLEEAESAGGKDHHFVVLQCPMNLLEAGAALQPNTGPDASRTVLEEAQHRQVAVLVNRPLNAILAGGSRMLRLADIQLEPQNVPLDGQAATVRDLEDEFRGKFATLLPKQQEGVAPSEYFRWGSIVQELLPRVSGLHHWDQLEVQMIAPHIHQVLQIAAQHLPKDKASEWEAWQKRYIPEVVKLLKAARDHAAEKSRAQADQMTTHLDPLLPEDRRAESLSRKALWILASTPGVTCVLNGMRTPGYVKDSLAILDWPPLADPHRVYTVCQSFSV